MGNRSDHFALFVNGQVGNELSVRSASEEEVEGGRPVVATVCGFEICCLHINFEFVWGVSVTADLITVESAAMRAKRYRDYRASNVEAASLALFAGGCSGGSPRHGKLRDVRC